MVEIVFKTGAYKGNCADVEKMSPDTAEIPGLAM